MIVDHDSTPASRQHFHAEFRAADLAEIRLFAFENAPMTVAHTAFHAARTNPDELLICRQLSGELVLEQDDRCATLAQGDITLLDPRLPYIGRCCTDSGLLLLKVPRRSLESRLGKVRQFTGRRIAPTTAESKLASAFLAMLPEHADGLDLLAAHMIKDQALDLIAAALGKQAEGERRPVSSTRSLVLMKLRYAIEAHLAQSAVNAAGIAAAAGVSVRYANDILAAEHTSVMRLLLSRRLERCRKALADPAQRQRTVTEIAVGWGFSDMTHFGRAFRAAYGQSPREFRQSIGTRDRTDMY